MNLYRKILPWVSPTLAGCILHAIIVSKKFVVYIQTTSKVDLKQAV
jgi:hypothetical protein